MAGRARGWVDPRPGPTPSRLRGIHTKGAVCGSDPWCCCAPVSCRQARAGPGGGGSARTPPAAPAPPVPPAAMRRHRRRRSNRDPAQARDT